MVDEVRLNLPKLSLAMAEATFVEWLVDDGASVAEGQSIYLLESDKVEVEVEAPAAGRIDQSAIPGETYAVGEQLGSIRAE